MEMRPRVLLEVHFIDISRLWAVPQHSLPSLPDHGLSGRPIIRESAALAFLFKTLFDYGLQSIVFLAIYSIRSEGTK